MNFQPLISRLKSIKFPVNRQSIEIPSYSWFEFGLFIIITAILILSTSSYISTFNSENNLSFCLTSKCITLFSQIFSGPLEILENGSKVIGAYVGVCGVYIALKTYLISVRSSALSGHVSHLNLFRSHIESEIAKRSSLSTSRIDVFLWYRLMFPNSPSGDTKTSRTYKELIIQVHNEIGNTNKTLNDASHGEAYCYKDHQSRLIIALENLGIKMERMPKNNFFEVETQVLDLIDSVNMTFSMDASGGIAQTPSRSYL
ncbi:retron Ec48 family effector membrane protein [Microbulbifer sp. CAU 1566]|uniref:retron Ec48 family effector membrane protein n=1 Tax=Microbulbifer sp. CAU 1566 TaxID=2933269 RepID=UPI002006C9D2|nr:retron Ec48 family effector membrane protein [Microbulbifer sp. CAU 1566]MCK7596464.1 retron Ec48 family effector membrane protein [Microbulbifer sp. CAU 1566]